ncbi:TLP18.3/Psb32/MOLO-1 phosphatase superfamily protein [Leucobacter komagatae]|uniref:TLP18.3/Psb32/MOLO-1 phosphatase superfamily protein n=1 Tax=Leucobacter komagatae TaxID=55969 RepID=A0A542Y360_9MICO|nr:TPM domain-containing protein [Leucobacter komagatae]TQL42507.1 TLP18.3/Psb32/MOLO-1 phosphatase superfamily protein [Leucobacter komagatae]
MKRVVTMLGLAALAGLAWLAPSAAVATAPPSFGGKYVIDGTSEGVLGSSAGKLEDDVREFATEHGVQLFVVYVDSFESPSDPEEWGAQTAQKNFLGDDAVLLSIAVDDRLYDLNAAQALMTDAQYNKLSNDYVRPALKNSDWKGVVGATLTGIEKSVLNPESNGTGVAVAVIGGVVVVGGVAAGVAISRKRKRDREAAEGEAPLTLEELESQASALLIRVDDDLRSSEQELGFAEAQFGAEAAQPFAAAIADAKEQLRAAFARRQLLDDNVPDSDEDRRAWLTEIIDRCTGAKESLDAHTESFSKLREVEQRGPEVLEELKTQLPVVQQALESGRERAAALSTTYAPTILAQLDANLAESAARLQFVGECIASAATELGAGERSAAAVSLRAGEAALDQARTLANSPDVLAGELAESTRQFAEAAADLQGDLQVVAQLIGSAGDADRQALQQAADRVSQLLARGTQGDPVAALTAAAAANVQIDAAIGAARENTERLRRAESARDEALVPARSEVLAAEQFIETRRGAIGSQARTRLAEAKRKLQLAEQYAEQDPMKSYQAAQQATQYARAAYQLAVNDVSGWGGGSGGSGGGSNGSFGGAVLGGILGGLLSGGGGGGRSSGGWSGSNGGFTGGWNGGGSIGGGGGLAGGGRRGGGGRF